MSHMFPLKDEELLHPNASQLMKWKQHIWDQPRT